jgi:hypothetical protein
VFNRNSIFDASSKYEVQNAEEAHPIGKIANDASGFLIGNARMLSGVSGMMIALHPSFRAGSGPLASSLHGLGSGLALVSALAGGNKNLASFDIFCQFLGSIVLFTSAGLANIHSGLRQNREFIRKAH